MQLGALIVVGGADEEVHDAEGVGVVVAGDEREAEAIADARANWSASCPGRSVDTSA